VSTEQTAGEKAILAGCLLANLFYVFFIKKENLFYSSLNPNTKMF